MLPNEILLEILRCLERRDLDATEITNSCLGSLTTEKKLSTLAFRRVKTMSISDNHSVLFTADDGSELRTELGRLGEMLAGMHVEEVEVSATFTASLYDALSPHVDTLNHCRFDAPTHYASFALMTRAFRELFFFRHLVVGVTIETDTYTRREIEWFRMPTVQQCESLRIDEDCYPTTQTDFFPYWINGARRIRRKKFTLIAPHECGFRVLPLDLKDIFKRAKRRSEYELTLVIYKPDVYGQDRWNKSIAEESALIRLERSVNERTQEELVQDPIEAYKEDGELRWRTVIRRRPISHVD